MSDAVQTSILITFFGALILALLAIVGFAGKRFFDHVDQLQNSIDTLRDTIGELSDKFVTQSQYKTDMETLRMRRATDICPREDCPFEERTDGGTPKIELTGSGAKSLAELLAAMRSSKP